MHVLGPSHLQVFVAWHRTIQSDLEIICSGCFFKWTSRPSPAACLGHYFILSILPSRKADFVYSICLTLEAVSPEFESLRPFYREFFKCSITSAFACAVVPPLFISGTVCDDLALSLLPGAIRKVEEPKLIIGPC